MKIHPENLLEVLWYAAKCVLLCAAIAVLLIVGIWGMKAKQADRSIAYEELQQLSMKACEECGCTPTVKQAHTKAVEEFANYWGVKYGYQKIAEIHPGTLKK